MHKQGDVIRHKITGKTGTVVRTVPQGTDYIYEVEMENEPDLIAWGSWNVDGVAPEVVPPKPAACPLLWCRPVRKVLFTNTYVACEACDKDMPNALV
jgi:hypothetical protein